MENGELTFGAPRMPLISSLVTRSFCVIRLSTCNKIVYIYIYISFKRLCKIRIDKKNWQKWHAHLFLPWDTRTMFNVCWRNLAFTLNTLPHKICGVFIFQAKHQCGMLRDFISLMCYHRDAFGEHHSSRPHHECHGRKWCISARRSATSLVPFTNTD